MPARRGTHGRWRLERYPSLDSTNAELVRRAKAGEPEGLAVIAQEQTKGRGRDGRAWSTGGADLALSVLLRPDLPPAKAAAASFVAALAVHDMAAALLPDTSALAIKWPNDVMIGDRKLCGILLEASGGPAGRVDWLAIGMGVNLAPSPGGRPPGAIDLVEAGAPELTPEAAAARLLDALDHWLDAWRADGFEPIRQAWRTRARDLGRQVVARLPQETVAGVAKDLAADGALVLALADGGERRIAAGDVFPATEAR